jgi:hypothetical protein
MGPLEKKSRHETASEVEMQISSLSLMSVAVWKPTEVMDW